MGGYKPQWICTVTHHFLVGIHFFPPFISLYASHLSFPSLKKKVASIYIRVNSELDKQRSRIREQEIPCVGTTSPLGTTSIVLQ
jgi:hypothetical protein